MPIAEATILSKVLDWAWIVVTGGIVVIFRKLFKHDDELSAHDTKLALLKQNEEACEKQRLQAETRWDGQRKEILARIDNHHKVVLKRLEGLADKL
jgi:hypothetical protein